ncbi:MAG: diguanylate cyclase, partial [Chromatiales bacterium]
MTTTNPAMPQILIISNDSDSSQSLQQALGPDYQLQLVQSAQQAWSSVNDSLPDLVVVDVVLPDSDAFELCRSLKNDLRLQLTPVVLAGDAASAETQQYALDQGAVDYLNKPFDLPLLKARLRTHIQLKQKIDLLEDLAMLDGLTGLANRQRMDIALQQEWRRAARNDAPLSVVMVDVDYLQQYNDHYGHAKGDQVLQRIADIMQQ